MAATHPVGTPPSYSRPSSRAPTHMCTDTHVLDLLRNGHAWPGRLSALDSHCTADCLAFAVACVVDRGPGQAKDHRDNGGPLPGHEAKPYLEFNRNLLDAYGDTSKKLHVKRLVSHVLQNVNIFLLSSLPSFIHSDVFATLHFVNINSKHC